ncbi:nicotinate-nucleotide adenylyltransferase [Rhizobium sp. CG4]|uniref:nicotinate-nucleotide adenylyltransferase n=1 Tax=Rhizobium/Agrobacterium group TaxID=227290 RepID=UPI001783734E|nr:MULTISPECIES: nicotinate-nucleotide adenylyltransferase [Rhizobium/Agrobacterium group]MBD9389538.1 nicotinate-nucleotide adenylyltransferase [Agrobacterium sp. AGB01]MCM2456894.1 nicotinate-nucleotide adenylyltransferase [Rhizobium sp. CG4]MDO5893924.1 nicotinate-nucleotide adenylyltransferase [Agrobacterium sp. Azo12]
MAPARYGPDVLMADPVNRRYLTMPHVERGMVVGLFGGSFNPPHGGHALVAEIALRRLGLDQLWWMVTPGNPLKNHKELAPLSARIQACEHLVHDPRIKITAFEKSFGVSYTANTLKKIKARNPGVRFIWIMGADNLKSFHRWQKWREIAETFPIAVIDRPGATLSYLSSTMAQAYSHARVDEDDAGVLWTKNAPAWTFVHGPRSTLSSTALRNSVKR